MIHEKNKTARKENNKSLNMPPCSLGKGKIFFIGYNSWVNAAIHRFRGGVSINYYMEDSKKPGNNLRIIEYLPGKFL